MRWMGVQRIEDLLEKPDILILVSENWKSVIKQLSTDSHNALIYPIWMAEILVNSTIDYYDLTKCDDVRERLKYLQEAKMISCVFGNCQTGPITELMSCSKEFTEDYYLIKMPMVQRLDAETVSNGFNQDFMECVDLFITMNISKTNKFSEKVSTDNIRSQVSEKCRMVIIPNCHFTAYFPQTGRKNINYLPYFLKPHPSIDVTEPDYYAEVAIQNDSPITRPTVNDILTNHADTIHEMIVREEECDIKISDYILSQYRSRRIFYSSNHPTKDVLETVVRRLLSYLGYSDNLIDKEVQLLDTVKPYIYPEVYETLQLRFRDENEYVNKLITQESLDEDAYLALLKFYKKPEYWKRSMRWITKPMERSIDLSANIEPASFVSIISKTLSLSGSAVQMSLDVITNVDVENRRTVVRIPECLAPSKMFFTTGRCLTGGAVKVRVSKDGKLEFISPVKQYEEVLIDTTWVL